MDLAEWHLSPWVIQYALGSILALAVSLYILSKNFRSWAYRSFFLFGATTTMWQILVFLHRSAPSQSLSSTFLGLSSFFNNMIQPVLLLTFLLLLVERRLWIISIVPGLLFSLYLGVTNPYEILGSSFGWTYRLNYNTVQLAVSATNFVGYAVAVASTIFYTMKRYPFTARRYIVFLSGYVLFTLGVLLSNFLILLDPEVPPYGGYLSFIMFLVIAYAANMPEQRIIHKLEQDRLSQTFTTFLKAMLENALGQEMGQSSLRLMDYIRASGLREAIDLGTTGLGFNSEKLKLDYLIPIVDKTLSYMEKNEWAAASGLAFLDVMDEVYSLIRSQDAKKADQSFDGLVGSHEDLLKRTDMIYGLAEGKFLGLITADNSLEETDDVEAAFKIYVRMLLVVRKKTLTTLGTERLKARVPTISLIDLLDFSESGIPIFSKGIASILTLPKRDRVTEVRRGLSSLLRWIYNEISSISEKEGSDVLAKFKLVLSLNRERASQLGVVRSLVLARGFSEIHQDIFSRELGLSHEQLSGKRMLLEFEPKSDYATQAHKFCVEALANSEPCAIFTRLGSNVEKTLSGLEDIKFFYLSVDITRAASYDKNVFYLPIRNLPQLSDIIEKMAKETANLYFVFDSLTDLILTLGLDETYRFLRLLIEILSSTKACCIFLLNMDAHEVRVKTVFEDLFNVLLVSKERTLQTVKIL